MIIDAPSVSAIPSLMALWKEAFGDDDGFINTFFSLGFSPTRALCAYEKEMLAGALYWFDMNCNGKKIAYIYGVATANSFRGRGIGTAMMKAAEETLRASGYEGIALVPAEKKVFQFYEKLGYKTFAYVDEKRFTASSKKTSVRKADATEYFEERKKYLKEGYLTLSEESFDFLEALVDFYVGKDFVLSLRKGEKDFFAVEFFGNFNEIPNLINSLEYSKGLVRTEGNDNAFAMYLPLQDLQTPLFSDLGFAFD